MIPAILGLGGLTARIVATAVIPRVVRAISSSFSTPKTIEPRRPLAIEGISTAPEPAPTPVLSGVSAPLRTSRKWGYAGLWHHQASGLDLATYRAYDAANKRWISRDPLGEGVDYNLYRYCGNSPINGTDSEGLAPFSGTLTVYAWGLGGRVQAVNVNINGNYDPHSGRVTAELGTQNLLPASARIKTTVSIQQLSSGDSGSFTIDEDDDSPVPSTKKKKKKCSARETQIDTYHRGQRTKRRYVAKMDPASFVRIRIDVVVDPIPILGGNPFSFGGQSVGVPFTQGSNTFILDGFHNRDNIVDIHDI